MSEIVTRLAVLAGVHMDADTSNTFEGFDPERRPVWIAIDDNLDLEALVRVILTGLRDNISEPMKEAAAYHSLSFSNGGDDSFSFEYLSGEDAADAFRDMIDVALTDPPTKTA